MTIYMNSDMRACSECIAGSHLYGGGVGVGDGGCSENSKGA